MLVAATTVRRLVVFAYLCVLIALAPGCFRRGSQVQASWQQTNGVFKVRILAYNEEFGTFPRHILCVFESNGPGVAEWHEFMTVRTKSGPEEPSERIRFVNDHIAYAFMYRQFAVTTDAGKAWAVWDTLDQEFSPGRRFVRPYIKNVAISPDGSGDMDVKDIDLVTLHTKDYGHHWTR